ncbi:UDP-N-acetylglucosamine diphosphorylase [Bacilliculturomica massiliensis]|uniref:UDP-N-acetylglucosamine diphosphorylase n=1 Tax=Bacilliculturomica massiliensis TaxID=1917867 RepID=UPI001FE6ADCA|nr:UDP-N-acetylglucosamine diphosphorylase [Bacilliculturomica massiliensis]
MDESTKSMENIEQLMEREQKKAQARLQIVLRHIQAGVEFVDWKSAYIDETVEIGEGTVIWPGAILCGCTKIGRNCVIGHNTRIVDSTIADEVEIQSSEILESTVGSFTKVGPFAYLRPNSHIGEHAKVGDFVEVKNSTLGNNSKASHLTYIGDSDVGDNVNLGCGVVFVNYDGQNKHRSVVKDGAFIGCNTNLVSPVTVGGKAYVAAGTTLTSDVPDGALAVGRAKQKNLEGWVGKRGLLDKKKK